MAKNKEKKANSGMFKLLRAVEKTLFRLIFPYKLHGNTTKYNDGGLIIIGNHYSCIDVAYPLRITDRPVHFVAKQELWDKGGIAKWFANACGCIPAKRDGSDVNTVKQSLKILKSGDVLSIFPEGTRNREYGEIKVFHSGSSALSIKTKSPIIPIVKVRKIRPFRRTDVIVGDPIEFRKFYDKKVTKEDLAECDKILVDAMNNMRQAFIERQSNGKK